MRVLVHERIDEDIKKCCRKKWYIGLDKELPRVIKLLQIKGFLPGEAPFHYVSDELKGNVFHAGICLPSSGLGKTKGPRIIYYKNLFQEEIKVLYVGGHKDRVYNTPKIVEVLKSRFLSGDFFQKHLTIKVAPFQSG